MENMIKAAKYILAYITGFLLFVFILFYLIGSFFRKYLAHLLKLPQLYHFREQQFSALDVTLKGDEKRVFLGRLPSLKNEILNYNLPAFVAAKEILVELKLDSKIAGNAMELDYTLSGDDAERRKENIYFFLNALSDEPDLNYNKVLCWFPIPKNRMLQAQLTDIISNKSAIGLEGELNIVKWR